MGTLPLVAHHFHLCAPFQIVFNLIAGLLVWVLLAFGMLLVVTAGLAGPAVLPFVGWASRTLIATVWYCHSVPGCYRYVVGPSIVWIGVYYALLALWLARSWLGIGPKHLLIATMLAANLYVFLGQRQTTDGSTRATFLDVGHGLSALVTLPDGHTLLYDVGSSGYPSIGKDIVAPALWAQGLRRIDAVVLSHPDADHFNGLTSLAERVELGSIVATQHFLRTRFGRRLMQYAERNRIPLLVAASGARIQVNGSATLNVLHPPPDANVGVPLSSNDSSLVLRVESSGRAILLTGDAEVAAWSMMRSTTPAMRADVVSLPHHGSYFPGYHDFAAPHTGAVAVASCRGELPTSTVTACAEAGVRMVSTAAMGAVRITLSPERMQVETFRQGQWSSWGTD